MRFLSLLWPIEDNSEQIATLIVPETPQMGFHALARFLPIQKGMGRPSTSTDALIEILSLCEQALLALHPDHGGETAGLQPEKAAASRRVKRTNIGPRLVLIRGGLWIADRGATAR